jgi:large subunit ribosomal protein L7/L12
VESETFNETPAAKNELDPVVEAVVADILKLNLFQVNQLVTHLKDEFGFVESAPVVMAAGPAAVGEEAEEKEEEVVREKTTFSLKLESFDAKGKIKIIKEVRAVSGLGLKESKELVEGAPCEIAKDLPKDEAEALVERLKEAGAVITLL